MQDKIKVLYDSGREMCFAVGEIGGGAVAAEYHFLLDDLAQGLFVEIGHHKPPAEVKNLSDEKQRFVDEHGYSCAYVRDFRMQIAEKEDLEHIRSIYLGDKHVLTRLGGKLVNLQAVNDLAECIKDLVRVADVAECLFAKQDDQETAEKLGIDAELLEEAREVKVRFNAKGGTNACDDEDEEAAFWAADRDGITSFA